MDVIIRGRAGEVRFEGFGRLRGQNGPPDRARSAGEQTKSGSWGGPFWRIWVSGQNGVPERERSTEAQPQEKGGHKTKEQLGKPALKNFGGSLTKAGHQKQQGAPPSKPGLGELGGPF
jgi:hypothetical protein